MIRYSQPFQKAIDLGADGIELDVHETKDGVPVVHHAYYLGMSNNGAGLISEKSHEALQHLDAGSWFDTQYKDVRIPTLEEVFKFFGNKISSVCLPLLLQSGWICHSANQLTSTLHYSET
jgi:glycerophosphoryl diester phosphodiesterase